MSCSVQKISLYFISTLLDHNVNLVLCLKLDTSVCMLSCSTTVYIIEYSLLWHVNFEKILKIMNTSHTEVENQPESKSTGLKCVSVKTPFRKNTILTLGSLSNSLSFDRLWKLFSEILLHVKMTALHFPFRFVSCTFMLPISCSTSSQRFFCRFTSGEWEFHHFEMTLAF